MPVTFQVFFFVQEEARPVLKQTSGRPALRRRLRCAYQSRRIGHIWQQLRVKVLLRTSARWKHENPRFCLAFKAYLMVSCADTFETSSRIRSPLINWPILLNAPSTSGPWKQVNAHLIIFHNFGQFISVVTRYWRLSNLFFGLISNTWSVLEIRRIGVDFWQCSDWLICAKTFLVWQNTIEGSMSSATWTNDFDPSSDPHA